MWSEGFTYQEISDRFGLNISKVNYEVSKAIKYLKEKNKSKL